jgi:hypothetical protein
MTESNKTQSNEQIEYPSKKTSRNYGGFIWGIVLGLFVTISYAMNLSTYEYQRTSKISLVLVILAFAVFGAIFGEKFMEKVGAWLQWF